MLLEGSPSANSGPLDKVLRSKRTNLGESFIYPHESLHVMVEENPVLKSMMGSVPSPAAGPGAAQLVMDIYDVDSHPSQTTQWYPLTYFYHSAE
ncbi:MAG: hypothetical protein KVP17_001438 [Porospora cf. gigantea B]|uniref:uncharacterized protein n=1 Tax=Porospora cf. gigantea B TaxID=2853592 RepID=UPI003571EB83|nr:MAG: hypothetical protein KVP17_001438 [Porospora cf. gigantea B]